MTRGHLSPVSQYAGCEETEPAERCRAWHCPRIPPRQLRARAGGGTSPPRREEGAGLPWSAVLRLLRLSQGCWVILAALPDRGHFRQAGMQENVLFTRSRNGVVLLMSLALGTSPCCAPSVLDCPLPAGSKAFISSSSLNGDGPYFCFRCLRTCEGGRSKLRCRFPRAGPSLPARGAGQQPGPWGLVLVLSPVGRLSCRGRTGVAEAGPTLRAAPLPNSASCCLKPGLGLATGRTVRMASSTSWQLSSVTAMT